MGQANVTSFQKLVDTNKRALLKYVYVSTGSAEANSILLDAASLSYALNANSYILGTGTDRKSKYNLSIKRIFGNFNLQRANGYVSVQWQGDTNSSIVVLGNGQIDYDFMSMGDGATISNPEANATGNILISTSDVVAKDSFTLFLDVRKDSADYDAGQTADPAAFNSGKWNFR